MELEFTPFSHDYYIMNLPPYNKNISKENRETLFNQLKYQTQFDYRNREINIASVIRLFGYHPDTGERMCVHVHGFFPYFYIKIEALKHLFSSKSFIDDFIDKCHEAYCMTFLSHIPKASHEKFKIIYNCEIVDKFDFYGAHFKKQQFLKLFLFDQQYMSQLVMLLASGAIMDYQFQAYESHLSYFMHFYSDLQLFGMSIVKIIGFKFRKRLNLQLEHLIIKNAKEFEYLMKFITDYSGLFKVTTCPIEIDCHYTAILNERFQEEKEKLEYFNLQKEFSQIKENSQFQIRRLSQRQQKANLIEEFNVELTLSLNKLWLDEQNNREKLKIQQPLLLNTDKSKNCENQALDSYPTINILDGNENARKQLEEHLKEFQQYQSNDTQLPQNECFINKETVMRFFSGQQEEKEICKKSIIERFKEYVTRKKDLFELIKEEGNIEYEFDFEQKENYIQEVIQQQEDEDADKDINDIVMSQEQEQQLDLFEQMKQNQRKKDKLQFKKKYHVNKNNIRSKTKTIFDICEFCNNNYLVCSCYARTQRSSIKKSQSSQQANDTSNFRKIYEYIIQPPSVDEVIEDLNKYQTITENQYVYYSNAVDLYQHYNIKKTPFHQLYTQLLDKQFIKTPSNRFYAISIRNELKMAELFNAEINNQKTEKNLPQQFGSKYLYLINAPTISEVLESIKFKEKKKECKLQLNSLIDQSQYFYPTQLSVKSNDVQDDIVFDENLSILLFEVFACKDNEKLPDPSEDQIDFIILQVYSIRENTQKYQIIIIQDYQKYQQLIEYNIIDRMSIKPELEIIFVQNEIHLLRTFAILVFLLDPDFISGYDLESKSLYYLVNRAETYSFDILTQMSRAQANYDAVLELFQFDEFMHIPSMNIKLTQLLEQFNQSKYNNPNAITKRQSFNQNPKIDKKQQYQQANKLKQLNNPKKTKKVRFNLYIVGRALINIWRNVATDMKITNYSIENVYYELFKIKNPLLENQKLSQYYRGQLFQKAYVIDYIHKRVQMSYDILNIIGLIPRSIEIAKLYGCDYESVGYRGSQFKIESVLNRVTKQNDFVLLAATRMQVSTQKALQCTPLVIEPPKMFSSDPVIVLDFQSLYPSIMIAYNLCYSTCLGNVQDLFQQHGTKRFGVKQVDLDIQSLLNQYTIPELLDKIIVTPNQVVFLKKEVREGILPKILIEFLMTRIMIKKSSYLYEKYPKIQKQQSFRQLAIKLFMNVMYGYCGASFSGRMPSGDIADSVVEIGRTLLNQCIEHIHKNTDAKVLYGDTDSLFVMAKGKSVEEAILMGQRLAMECTNLYPYPIELKFEKVYSSMFLVAKKRYAGFKVEKAGQTPTVDGKGLEMIRRDGCKAVVKIMKKVINMIFTTKDLSIVKSYMQQQWSKILNGHYNPMDFIIAKEVKLGSYANPNRLPAHAVVATKLMEKDPMRRPKGGERMPYLVIQGMNKNAKIKDLVVSVSEFLSNPNYQINKMYYIQKQINAALGRLFCCFDVDINDWFSNLPKDLSRKQQQLYVQFEDASKIKATQNTINKYFKQNICMLCSEESKLEICINCQQDSRVVVYLLQQKSNILLSQFLKMRQCCQSCAQINFELDIDCKEWLCPLIYSKIINQKERTDYEKSALKYMQLAEDFNN